MSGLEECLPAVIETTTLEVGSGQVEEDLRAVEVEELPQAVLILYVCVGGVRVGGVCGCG